MKYLLAGLMVIHGLIHLLGGAKGFGLAELPQLSRVMGRTEGLLWLLACVLWLVTAGWLLLAGPSWWLPGLGALLLSQGLIVRNWQDARFGSLANLLLGLALIIALAQWQFMRQVRQELQQIWPASLPAQTLVEASELQGLPPVVRQWLLRAGVVGKPRVVTAHAQQQGKLRTQPGGDWLPVQSEQFFSTQPPAFGWRAEVQMMPGLTLHGWDSFITGKGRMQIKALGLLPVVNSQGPEIDQGAMLRYLGELVWLPSAALAPELQWQQLDAHSARATFSLHGQQVSADFHFSSEGDFAYLEALRYYDRPEGASLEKWRVSADPAGYRSFEGVRIPARNTVSWQLKDGDFDWYQQEIVALEYNRSAHSK